MCGRYVITSPPEALRAAFGYIELPNIPPRYNIAPTQPIPVITQDGNQRHFRLMRWGLWPSWVKDPKDFPLIINARADGVRDKPAFRAAMRYRRCLIPADGFYEWQPVNSSKRPYFLHPADGAPIAFAGLYETWAGSDGEEVDTAAIITIDATKDIAPIHARMPAVIAPEAMSMWLDCAHVDEKSAEALLAAPRVGFFKAYEVSRAVNRTINDSAELIAPVASTA